MREHTSELGCERGFVVHRHKDAPAWCGEAAERANIVREDVRPVGGLLRGHAIILEEGSVDKEVRAAVEQRQLGRVDDAPPLDVGFGEAEGRRGGREGRGMRRVDVEAPGDGEPPVLGATAARGRERAEHCTDVLAWDGVCDEEDAQRRPATACRAPRVVADVDADTKRRSSSSTPLAANRIGGLRTTTRDGCRLG